MSRPATTRGNASRRPHGMIWCLCVVVSLQCVGLCGKYLLSSRESESDIYGVLYFDQGWPESLAQRIDDGGAAACLIAGLVTLLIGIRSTPKRFESLICTISLSVVFAWFLLISITHMMRGDAFASLSLGEHAVRYAVALALLMVFCDDASEGPGRKFGRGWGVNLLVVASAATFIVHGYKAWLKYSPFTDLILLSDANRLGLGIQQSSAENALVVIGVVDIVVAVVLLATRWPVVAAYMVVWGMITSISRMTAFGVSAWPETLIRAANWGAPLAIVVYDRWANSIKFAKED